MNAVIQYSTEYSLGILNTTTYTLSAILSTVVSVIIFKISGSLMTSSWNKGHLNIVWI